MYTIEIVEIFLEIHEATSEQTKETEKKSIAH